VRRFDGVVLDFDGVLVESVDVKTRAFARLYSRYGADVEAEVVAYHLANGGMSRFQKFRYFHGTLLGEPLSAAQEAALGREFSALVEDAVVSAPWVPGALEFLDAHHRELPLFVASGTPEDELKRIVERRGMAHYFADVRGAPASKGEIISSLVAQHGLDPQRTLMVGDARADYEGARQAGVAFLGIGAQGSTFLPKNVALLPDMTGAAAYLLAKPAAASSSSR
jgi:phosphoglycolate phosphatase-like HAD superfamily hydrolase